MPERERWRTRALHAMMTSNYEQCVQDYGELIKRYPADHEALNNRSFCSSLLRHWRDAFDDIRKATAILPNRQVFRMNLALNASYVGDFQTGEQEARTQQPGVFSLTVLALAQSGQGLFKEAGDTYKKLAAFGVSGESAAASGLGDLAIVEGRFSDAVRILRKGAANDTSQGISTPPPRS